MCLETVIGQSMDMQPFGLRMFVDKMSNWKSLQKESLSVLHFLDEIMLSRDANQPKQNEDEGSITLISIFIFFISQQIMAAFQTSAFFIWES